VKQFIGSVYYMAPEVLCSEFYNNRCDIYSIAVLLYEMLYNICPYETKSKEEQIKVVKEGKFIHFPRTPKISPDLEKLLRRMLTINPEERIQWDELFKIDFKTFKKT